MRALVIGGTAFMGPHVVKFLKAAGHEVAVFHRGKTGVCGSDILHIHGDRKELPAFRSRFATFAPDVVVHMVAMNQLDADLFVEALGGLASRVVLISSVDVYRAYGRFCGVDEGPVDNTPVTETSALRAKRYPYRKPDTAPDSPFYSYDKIIVSTALANM
jgi:nucleoside-diphosphate-sugar epimerase